MCSINRKVYIAYECYCYCFVDLPRHIAMFEPTLMHLRVTIPQAPPIAPWGPLLTMSSTVHHQPAVCRAQIIFASAILSSTD